jgi:K+ transporter
MVQRICEYGSRLWFGNYPYHVDDYRFDGLLFTCQKIRYVVDCRFIVVYVSIEGSFLVANLRKFVHGGYVSLIIATAIIALMIIWYRAFIIKMRLTEYVKLVDYIEPLKDLSQDMSIPKYATHLVFMSNAARTSEIESKIIYSIFQNVQNVLIFIGLFTWIPSMILTQWNTKWTSLSQTT